MPSAVGNHDFLPPMHHDATTLTPPAFAPIGSHKLLIFHAVAATGSIAKAARQLCLTRSALSHAMRTLEDELGCDLFARTDQRMSLTAAGTRLLPHARSILEEMDKARLSVTNDG